MTRFLPKSLFGQTLLILLVGLVVSQLIGAWIYAGAREQAVRAIGGLAAAQRVANLTRLVEDAPADWRPRIVQALSDPTFHVLLAPRPPAQLPSRRRRRRQGDRGLCAPATSRPARPASAGRRVRAGRSCRPARHSNRRSMAGRYRGRWAEWLEWAG